MRLDQATAAINRRWLLLWPGASGDVPFVLDNNQAPEAPVFARLRIITLGSDQETLAPSSKAKFVHSGLIDVRLNGPRNVGRGQLDLLSQHVRRIYQAKRFGGSRGEKGVVTHAMSVNAVNNDRDYPQLWILSCSIPFEFTEVGP